ncbi:hypothetical protein BC833DRAFT_623261 [Globomyces pollinis-pini]|nr:hypothetical protein BC833DRAFT_623261 [Globomyces pollinis-pini]
MRFDELYILALVNSGISLTFLNIESLKERKPGAVLQLLTILGIIMFIIPQLMISCSYYDNQQVSMYLIIVAYLADYLSAVSFGLLYTYRLQAFSCLSSTKTIRFACILLIIPFLYGIVDILSIAIVLGYNFPIEKYTIIYHVVNLALVFYMMIMNASLSLILLKMKQEYSIQFTTPLILALFTGSLLCISMAIWGIMDSTVGVGPLYAAWTLDVLSFQYTTSNITKVLTNPEVEKFDSEE